MTKPIGNEAPKKRDPDGLYQNDSLVGKVRVARVTLNESKVYFEQIENAGDLNQTAPFEYREYKLRFVRADAYIGMLVTNAGVAANVYRNVVCEIVGRVQ